MPASQKLTPPPHRPIARRVVRYVNRHWDGNLTEAAKALGCKYDALRATAMGANVRVNFAVLVALAKHSGQTVEEWTK